MSYYQKHISPEEYNIILETMAENIVARESLSALRLGEERRTVGIDIYDTPLDIKNLLFIKSFLGDMKIEPRDQNRVEFYSFFVWEGSTPTEAGRLIASIHIYHFTTRKGA